MSHDSKTEASPYKDEARMARGRIVPKPTKEELQAAIDKANGVYAKKAPHLHRLPSAKYRKNRN